jgi:hypothetical protein
MSEMLGSPAVTVILEFERRPRVIWDCVNDAETSRLADWIAAHRDYAALVEAAYELATQERAA